MKNYYPSPLSYVWPLAEAEKCREIIVQKMEEAGFQRHISSKKQTIDLQRSQDASQSGSVQWGGQEARIRETDAVAYIVLRFYKQVIPDEVYKKLVSLGLRQDETVKSGEVRFFFGRDDFDLSRADKSLLMIQKAWEAK